MIRFTSPRGARGVSLIEVLIAVLIFSVGLLSMAGLMVMASRSNQAGFLRTQVAYLAHNMADRMRANPIGVWDNAYNGSYPTPAATAICDLAAGCTPDALALHDQQMWDNQLATFLPSNATAGINCTSAALSYVPTGAQLDYQPPYGGTCTMSITWSERQSGNQADRASALQTYQWEFQP